MDFPRFKVCVALLALWLGPSCQNLNARTEGERALHLAKEIRTAQTAFRETRGGGRYGTLGELAEAGLITGGLADGVDGGHRFEVRADGDTYEAVVTPLARGDNIGWSFYLNESGVIRGRVWGETNGYIGASKDDPPIGNQQ